MKIFIDSTIAVKDDRYMIIPLEIIKKDGSEIIDANTDKVREMIIAENDKKNFFKTSFLNPTKLEEMLPKDEESIIVMVPASVSGQSSTYTQYFSKHKNVHLMLGIGFYSDRDEFLRILNQKDKAIAQIRKEIDEFNSKVNYDGVILDVEQAPPSGKVLALVRHALVILRAKLWMKFTEAGWEKHKIIVNSKKSLRLICQGKKEINISLSTMENSVVAKNVEHIKKMFPKIKINLIKMTNSMLIHSGNAFLIIY